MGLTSAAVRDPSLSAAPLWSGVSHPWMAYSASGWSSPSYLQGEQCTTGLTIYAHMLPTDTALVPGLIYSDRLKQGLAVGVALK